MSPSFTLPRECDVTLDVYDAAGRSVTILQSEALPAGSHEIEWDGRDARGRAVASGVYFSRLTAGKLMQSRKMILAR